MNKEKRSLGRSYQPAGNPKVEDFPYPIVRPSFFSMNIAKEIATGIGLDNIESIVGGLDGDFDTNSCNIYSNGEWKEYDVDPGSLWAKPIILVYYKNGETEAFGCYEEIIKDE